MYKVNTFLISSFFLCSLLGCSQEPVKEVPQGTFTFTGSLLQAPLSTVRRGTHILEVSPTKRILLASTGSLLSTLVTHKVQVQGVFHANIDPTDEPVLEVSTVSDLSQLFTTVSYFRGMTFSVPIDWVSASAGSRMVFSNSGAQQFLVLQVQSGSLPKTGESILCGMHIGVSTVSSMQTRESVCELGNQRILKLSYSPPPNQELAESLRLHITSLLRSLNTSSTRSSSSSIAGSGSSVTQGQPCGGEAGILCPSGSYCSMSDSKSTVGRCVLLP
jgi:hypothetical protein